MRFAALVLSAVLCVTPGCDRAAPPTSGGGKPVIVATIYPLADITRQLVADAADVVCLVPPGASPHGFEPTAAESEGLAGAAALVHVGMGFDNWALRALAAHGSATIPVIAMATDNHEGHADHDDHDEHEPHDDHDDHDDADHHHAGPNPHIWLDPVRMAAFAHRLGHQLADLLPDHADAIVLRAEQLEAQLHALDAEYRSALAPFPEPRTVITFHDAFNVLAERYHITVAATLMPVDSSNSLTGARIENAIAVIRRHRVAVVYTEPQFPAEAGDVLRNEAAVSVMTLDPLGDPNVPERATYPLMMRYNLRNLVAGFKANADAANGATR